MPTNPKFKSGPSKAAQKGSKNAASDTFRKSGDPSKRPGRAKVSQEHGSSVKKVASPVSKGSTNRQGNSKTGTSTTLSTDKNISLLTKLFSCFRKSPEVAPTGDKRQSEKELLQKALGEGGDDMEEEPALVIDASDVASFVADWGYDFVSAILSDYSFSAVLNWAAVHIQRVIRGCLGRRAAERFWREAVDEFTEFWNEKHQRKLRDKELLKRMQQETQKLAMDTVKKSIHEAIADQQRIDAALRIQSLWRGHVVRQVFSYLRSIHRMRSPYKIKTVERKSRLPIDAKRVLWARKYYEPAGGWPGRADYLEYDMWEHTDTPPKGRDFGLKTHKVKSVPSNTKDKEILRTDKNAWVAFPISVVTEAESRPVPTPHVQHMMHTSPYRARYLRNHESREKNPAPHHTVQGTDQIFSLGWNPAMIDRSLTDQDVIAKVRIGGGSSMLSYLGDASTLPSNNSVEHLEPGIVSPNKQRGVQAGHSVSAVSAGQTQFPMGSSFQSHCADDNSHERHVRKIMDVPSALDTISKTDAVTLWHSKGTYLSFRKASTLQRTKNSREIENVSHLKTSSWGKIKSVAEHGLFKKSATILPGKKLEECQEQCRANTTPLDDVIGKLGDARSKNNVKSRTSVWPTRPKPHFKLRYTWLPQPLVKSAVETLYFNEDGTEKSTWSVPFDAGSPPRNNKSMIQKSHVFDPDFDIPLDERPRTTKPDDDARSTGSNTRSKSPKRTARMSMLMNNMNSLSAISSASNFESTVNSSVNRNKFTGMKSPTNKALNEKASHPYHWL